MSKKKLDFDNYDDIVGRPMGSSKRPHSYRGVEPCLSATPTTTVSTRGSGVTSRPRTFGESPGFPIAMIDCAINR